MGLRKLPLLAIISGAIAITLSPPARAQVGVPGMHGNVITAPDYGSGVSAGSLSNSNFNTPESDGRPGVQFFILGVQAFREGDYRHAIDMYQVAASWAYKPAEYNLGVMFLKGQGVPADRPLGAAWMVLAAERGNAEYVKARDVMVTLLSKVEFARTDLLWGKLKQTCGDKVALRRARAQWAWAKTHQMGTRVGGATGELSVGVMDSGHAPVSLDTAGRPIRTTTTAAGMMQGGSVDGSIAYHQLRQSDDPYSPLFLKSRSGTVSVEPLQPVNPASKAKQNGARNDGSLRPHQPPRNG